MYMIYRILSKTVENLSNLFFYLELRQYKKDSREHKIRLFLKLPHFFPHRIGEGKSAAISKLADSLVPLSLS